MKTSRKLLALLMALALSLTLLPSSALAASSVTVIVPGEMRYDYVEDIFESVNENRASREVDELTLSGTLTELAMQRAAECALYYSHTRPNGNDCFTILRSSDYRNTYGAENIAAGQSTTDAVMTAWMNSAGHRANILSEDATQIGIGAFENNGTIYWVQLFANGDDSSTPSTSSKSVDVEVETSTSRISTTLSSDQPLAVEIGDKLELPTLFNKNAGTNRTTSVIRPLVEVPNEIASVENGDEGSGEVYVTGLKDGSADVALSAYRGEGHPRTVNLTVGGEAARVGYQVTFDANGGTVSPQSQETNGDGRLNTLPTPTREGFAFVGWYTAKEGGTQITPNNVYFQDTTIYAHWLNQASGFTITYDPGEGSVTPTSGRTRADGTIVNIPTPTRKGYVFGGWFTEKDGGVRVDTTTVFDQDATVYARWSGDAYVVNVTAGEGGTITASARRAMEGDTVTLTVELEEGYVLSSLTVSGAGGLSPAKKVSDTTYTFRMPASAAQVRGEFKKAESPKPSEPDTPSAPDTPAFSDIANLRQETQNAILWANEQGFMGGYGDGRFGPANNVNRRQMWMVLARMAGEKPADMAAAQEWAMSNSYSDGSNPTGLLSRQQMATMLYRFALAKRYNVSGGDLAAYPDQGDVSASARSAMTWAVGNGIITGTSDGRLNPAGTATRAQFAVILYRFQQKYA